jgi:periplasmic divalent cation tolerance protein
MEPRKEHVCVLVTTPNISVARKIAAATLKEKLVACANLIPKVESHYWWEGKLESSSEVLMVFKTRTDKLPELERCVVKNHPYQTPEFIAFEIAAGNEKYLNWINDSVATQGDAVERVPTGEN